MGSSITKLVRGGLAAMTFGTSELLGIGKAIDPKLKKVGQESALDLAADKAENSKKRRELYATSGGVLGQEVSQIGNEERGSLFGN